MANMKVLMLLTKLFRNDARVYYEAKALADAGHNVSVLVWAKHDTKRELPPMEVVEGIDVHYIHDPEDKRFTQLGGMLWWWRAAYRKALEIHEKTKLDVVHCHDLDTLPIGVKLKKKKGLKLVYDAHEIFHWMIQKDQIWPMVFGAKMLEKMNISKADQIITPGEPCRIYLTSITKKPITIMMNCKPLYSQRYIPPKNATPVFIYIGILHQSRMFPDIVDVLGNVEGVKFLIAGKKESLYTMVEERAAAYPNVTFLGSIPYTDVLERTVEADVVLCPIDPSDENNSRAIANKQFEAMVCGRPIIVSEKTYAGEITREHNVGLTVEHTTQAFREAVIKMRDDAPLREELGKRALQVAIEKFNWETEKRKLVELYRDLLK